MDGTQNSILADELYARLGTASAPMVLDVRRGDAFSADDRVIVSAVHCDAPANGNGSTICRAAKPVVVYCADGEEISQAAAARCTRPASPELTSKAASPAGKERGTAHPPQIRRPRKQMGDARAAEDRSHRLPLAHSADSSIPRRIHLCARERGSLGRGENGRHALRHRGRRIRP